MKVDMLLLKIPHFQTRIYLSDLWNDLCHLNATVSDGVYDFRVKRRFRKEHNDLRNTGTCSCGYTYDPMRDREWRDHKYREMEHIRDEMYDKRRWW